MAEELHSASRADNKRKLDDQPSLQRRSSGFSSPPGAAADVQGATPPSYNSVPPPPDGFQLAKQRAQEIAAKLFSEAEAKRPKFENGGGGGADDPGEKSHSPMPNDYFQKPVGLSMSGQGGMISSYGFQVSSKKIDIPNGRVGVIIGKGGETIKRLQTDSGARIQVTRDMDADPRSQTRSVELMGTPDQINKAEEMITSVLAEADAGVSSLNSAQAVTGAQAGSEHFTMRVPNNKVGLIIGKGGETIKSMQMKSGARIQLIPLHLPPGDTSTERTVHIDGTSECIEVAKQLVNEVISDNRVRNPGAGGGYSQQGYGPPRPPSWAPSGQPPMQQPSYGYMQPGAYPGQPPQYNIPQATYGGYQQPPQSGGFSSGWDQSSAQSTQQTNLGSGYDYYSQQPPPQQPVGSGVSSAPVDANSYYAQQPSAYGSQGSYSESAYPQSNAGQQPAYGQDAYAANYHAPPPPQPGYAQPAPNPQTAYQQGYGGVPAYGAAAGSNQDGATPNYGVQGTVPQPGPPVNPSSSQPGYGATQQSTPHSGYGAPNASQQPGYGGQPPQPTYGQVGSYGQSPQGQKQPPTLPYGQGSQSGYSHGQLPPPSSGYGGGPPSGYGQPPPYGLPPQSQPAYGQAYADSYNGSGGYAGPQAYANDNVDAPVTQPASSGAAKASPQS